MKIKLKKCSEHRIFILEDDEQRINWFKYTFSYCSTFITQDVEVAKKALTDHKFDVIFLDHDLEGRAFVDSDEPNTGYQVAKVLRDSINVDTFCVVHSMNVYGSNNIASLLKNKVQFPFSYLINNIEISA